MPSATGARVSGGHHARIGLGVVDQLLEALEFAFGTDRNRARRAVDQTDQFEIAITKRGQALVFVTAQVKGDGGDGVAVRTGLGDRTHADGTHAACFVLHVDVDAEIGLGVLDEDARERVGAAARRPRYDHRDVFFRKARLAGRYRQAHGHRYGCGRKKCFLQHQTYTSVLSPLRGAFMSIARVVSPPFC